MSEDWSDWVGRFEHAEDFLTPALVWRFRNTIDSDATDESGPQAIHWCLFPPVAPTSQLAEDGHPARSASADGFLPPSRLPRRMWASGYLEFLAAMPVGARVMRSSRIAAITAKQGATGPLLFVDVDHLVEAGGIPAIRERQTLVYREAGTGRPQPAPPARAVDCDAPPWRRTTVPTETLLFRYSALTCNSHRIHYDRPYAVEIERYRGLVVQGPLVATLLIDLAARNLGADRLRTFSFRADTPAFAGESLHLTGGIDGASVTLAALGQDGRTVMSATATT